MVRPFDVEISRFNLKHNILDEEKQERWLYDTKYRFFVMKNIYRLINYLLVTFDIGREKPTNDSSSWFLVNLNKTGFYRINYPIDNWRAIIDELSINHAVYNWIFSFKKSIIFYEIIGFHHTRTNRPLERHPGFGNSWQVASNASVRQYDKFGATWSFTWSLGHVGANFGRHWPADQGL